MVLSTDILSGLRKALSRQPPFNYMDSINTLMCLHERGTVPGTKNPENEADKAPTLRDLTF